MRSSCSARCAWLPPQARPPSRPGLSPTEREVFRRIKARIIREATETLADDRFEGRSSTLQPGGDEAAAWIADRVRTLGLAPGGEGGTYLQQVPLVATELVEPTRVSVDGTPLIYGTDWSTLGTFADVQVSPPLVSSAATGRCRRSSDATI